MHIMNPRERPKVLKRAFRIALENHAVATVIAIAIFILTPWWILWCFLYLCGLIFLISILAAFVEDWRPRAYDVPNGKAVFITGCDSGFGKGLAKRLDELGLQVFAGCLFPDKEGAQSLKESCSERLHIVPLDVTSDESVQIALEYVEDHIGNNKFWALVNNAGINSGGEVPWTSLDTIKRISEVNTFGVVRVTKAFIPLLCRDEGRIVTTVSVLGRVTFAGLIPYCMSKYSAASFCEGLRMELSRFNVKVVSIEPWFYSTAITDADFVISHLKKAWEDSPGKIKEMYPEDYLEAFKSTIPLVQRDAMSDKPQDVIACLEEAVMAIDPKYVYNPGKLYCRFMFWFVRRLNKSMQDAFFYDEYYSFTNVTPSNVTR